MKWKVKTERKLDGYFKNQNYLSILDNEKKVGNILIRDKADFF